MKIPLLIAGTVAGCLFLAVPNNTEVPGPQDFRRLYGEPTMERFAAASGVTVTVEYGPDRLACQLLIESERLLFEVRNPLPPMSSESVSQILQVVVPADTRGKQIATEKLQVEGNQLLRTDYENVSIRRVCSVYACGPSSENQDLATVVVFKRASCPKHIE